MKSKINHVRLFVILLALIFLSSFAASLFQSSTFSVKMTELKNVTNAGVVYDDAGQAGNVAVNGTVVSGMLFVPRNATAANPAPAICLTHGYLNNWQLQLQNAIELSRRGFVVLVIDQQGHGDNNNLENWPAGQMPWTINGGLYNAAKYLYNLDFVDKSKVGISGHSMGGEATDVTLIMDGARCAEFCEVSSYVPDGNGLGIISAAIMQGFDPVDATTPGGYIDMGLWNDDVAVGILKGSDDEFFFINKYPDGTTTRCRDYLDSVHAADFTKTGYTVGDNASVIVENGGIYVDGTLTTVTEGTPVGAPFRVIYQNEGQIHPQNHFSVEGAKSMINFFYAAFGTPNGAKYISSSNQVWWIKEAFSTIGLLCFFALVIPLSGLLLQIPFFAGLKAKEDNTAALRPLKGMQKNLSYWVGAVICAIFAGCSFVPLYGKGGVYFPLTSWFPQDTTNPVLFWASCVGLFTLAVILVTYIINYVINKKVHAADFEKYDENPFLNCVMPGGLAGFLKTLLLAAVTVILLYTVVFVIWGIFKVDFRIWSFDVKTFDIYRFLPTMVRYLPVFAIFYCINAFANSTYRVSNLPEWATILINAAANVAGVLIMLLTYYSKFMATGVAPTMMLPLIVVFPLVGLLPIITVISRVLFNRTGNIWYGAFVNTMLVTAITAVNTAASYAYVVK